jgi:hypothetical protein
MQPVVSATAQEETSQYEIQYRNSSFGCLFNLLFNRYYGLQQHGPGRPNLGLRDGFTEPVEWVPVPSRRPCSAEQLRYGLMP